MFVVQEQEDRTIPEDTIVRGKLKEMFKETVTYTKDGKDESFDHIVWWFEITTEPYASAGRKVRGTCFPELTNAPGNRFRLWVEALLGRPLGLGEVVNPDDLVGLSVDLTVSHREGTGKSAGKIFEDVDEVMPKSGGAPVSAANVPAPADDDVPF